MSPSTPSVGFLGAGSIARAVATLLAEAGVSEIVLSNSRGPASLSTVVAEYPALRAGSTTDAARCDLVFCAVPWSRIRAALGSVPDWTGTVLVDATNPLEAPTFTKADLGGRTSSEVVASLAPGAKVVKAFNHLAPPTYAAGPVAGRGRRLLFVSSDHRDAKAAVLQLIERTGYVGIDLGGLATGGALHEFPGGPLPARDFVELT